MIYLPPPVRLQWLFGAMIGLLERLGLHTNVEKTVTMVYQTVIIVDRDSTPTYGSQMTVKGDSHQLWQRHLVICTYCGADLVTASLDTHI